jgi:hypothetical protein
MTSRLDDWLFNPEQVANRRSHQYLLSVPSSWQRPISLEVDPSGQRG